MVDAPSLRRALADHGTTRAAGQALGIAQSTVVRTSQRFGIVLPPRGPVPCHDRVLPIDAPEQVTEAEFLRLYSGLGAAMTAYLLGRSLQTVQQRRARINRRRPCTKSS